MADLEKIADELSALTVLEASELSKLLEEKCASRGIPTRLVAKLIDLERDMQGMNKRTKIFKKMEKIFREDWLDEQAVQRQYEIEDS